MQEIEIGHSSHVLYGLDEIAAYLRVSRRTAQRWLYAGHLPAMCGPSRVYRTTTSLIDAWLIAGWSVEAKARKIAPAA